MYDEALDSLCHFIRINSSLLTLSLKRNALDNKNTNKICDALSYNRSIYSVDLSDNSIGSGAFSSIISLLKSNKIITELYLYICSILLLIIVC